MRGIILVVSLVVIGLCLAVPIALLGVLGILLALVLTPLVGFCLVYFLWAPNDLFFTFVTEGMAKIVVKAGAFDRVLIQFKDHALRGECGLVTDEKDHECDIVPYTTTHRRILGGLRYFGPWPLYYIYHYHLRWTSVHQDGTIAQHDEELDQVLLKDHIYLVQIKGAEDAGMVPLDIDLLLTMRVINPYKAIFKTQDWIEMVLGRMKPAFRQYVSAKSFEELVKAKQEAGEEIWKILDNSKDVKAFREEYGIDIADGGIEMKDVTPPLEYQQAATLEYLANMEKKKVVVGSEAEKARLENVYGTIRDLGETGRLVRTLEAAEKSPLAASLTVQAIPGLQEVMRGVFSQSSQQGQSSQDQPPQADEPQGPDQS